MFNFFFGERGGFQQIQPQPRLASGSGVILESDGYIVTNNHVVDGADSITVTLNDKRTFDAKVIGTSEIECLTHVKYLHNDCFDKINTLEWYLKNEA